MDLNGRLSTEWQAFLLVAAAGFVAIYAVSTLSLARMPKTATLAIIGIVVFSAYEYFIGWG